MTELTGVMSDDPTGKHSPAHVVVSPPTLVITQELVRQVPALAVFGIVIGFVVWTFVGFLSTQQSAWQVTTQRVAEQQLQATERNAKALSELASAVRDLKVAVDAELAEDRGDRRRGP